MSTNLCRSFKPIVDAKSRVLVLGSMPGPVALKKQQYYGFEGNHFWTIVPALFHLPRPMAYDERIALVRKNRIALWDVLESCVRPGAADSDIKKPVLNKIPTLLNNHPQIRAVFVNGRTAYNLLVQAYATQISQPVFCLPSSSPANAAIKINEKIKRWSVLLDYLKN